ncbi:MAG TPA: hypothetical protein VF615_14955 [Longimicrobiaceae bacterium]|jgi:hypothetical protein
MAEDAPPHPAHVADWEDLLVRLEIAPRALRVTLEDAPAGDPEVRALVARAAAGERVFQRMMEAMHAGDPLPDAAAPAEEPGEDARTLAETFTSVRMRTFAMAQRRGVDVWAWQSADAEGRALTVYQLFNRMVREDARLLAALRDRIRAAGGAPC